MNVKEYKGPVDEFYLHQDSLVIYGRCYHPAKDPDGSYPAMLIAHEFASNANSTSRFAIPFSEQGYHVFVFDFTGSKGTKSYGREDIDCSILTDKEEMEIVYEYMMEQPYVDQNHIVLCGCSQGGLTAGLLAADHKEEVKALMMYYPALCGPDYLRSGYMMGKSFDAEEVPEYIEMYRGTGIGRKYITDMRSLDPWTELTVYEHPVLICHGTWDSIAAIRYSREAAARYKDCTLLEIEKGEHIFKVPENFKQAMETSIDFLHARCS